MSKINQIVHGFFDSHSNVMYILDTGRLCAPAFELNGLPCGIKVLLYSTFNCSLHILFSNFQRPTKRQLINIVRSLVMSLCSFWRVRILFYGNGDGDAGLNITGLEETVACERRKPAALAG